VVDYSHSASFCLLTDQPAEKLSRCGRRRSPRCCWNIDRERTGRLAGPGGAPPGPTRPRTAFVGIY